jgi:MFS family permease
MTKPNFKQANKRYHRLFTPAMIAYGICVTGGIFLVHFTGPDNLFIRILAGLGAGIPLVVAIWALMRFVRETDEFNRQMNLSALAFAGGVTAGFAALVGFLQMYDVVPKFPAFWFTIIYFSTYRLGQAFANKGATQCGTDEG